MEYVAIGLCLIAIIAVGVILYQRKKKEATTESFVPKRILEPGAAAQGDHFVFTYHMFSPGPF